MAAMSLTHNRVLDFVPDKIFNFLHPGSRLATLIHPSASVPDDALPPASVLHGRRTGMG